MHSNENHEGENRRKYRSIFEILLGILGFIQGVKFLVDNPSWLWVSLFLLWIGAIVVMINSNFPDFSKKRLGIIHEQLNKVTENWQDIAKIAEFVFWLGLLILAFSLGYRYHAFRSNKNLPETHPIIRTITPTLVPTELPTMTATPTLTPTELPAMTATPTLAPTELPTMTATPTSAPTELPTMTATPTLAPTELPAMTATPTLASTELPAMTATPTLAPTELLTMTPIPTSMIQNTSTVTPRSTSACKQEWLDALENAFQAQKIYMINKFPSSKEERLLKESWNSAWKIAREQASIMMKYNSHDIQSVRINNVTWKIVNCEIIDMHEDYIEVKTDETWEYDAELHCQSGTKHDSLWIEHSTNEQYKLLRKDGEWRVDYWNPGKRTIINQWKCP